MLVFMSITRTIVLTLYRSLSIYGQASLRFNKLAATAHIKPKNRYPGSFQPARLKSDLRIRLQPQKCAGFGAALGGPGSPPLDFGRFSVHDRTAVGNV